MLYQSSGTTVYIGERLILTTSDYLLFHLSIPLTLSGCFALGFPGNMKLNVERHLVWQLCPLEGLERAFSEDLPLSGLLLLVVC